MVEEKEPEKKSEKEDVKKSQVIAIIRDKRTSARGKVQLTPRKFVDIRRLERGRGKKGVFRALTPEEDESYRFAGWIPVERHIGKPVLTVKDKRVRVKDESTVRGSPVLKFRCDSKTYMEIKKFQETLVDFNLSETIRYLILKGLQFSQNSHTVRLSLPDEVYNRLMEHLDSLNKTEGLNLSLGEYILLILERAVGLTNGGS